MLRFDREWAGQVPAPVRFEARAHDPHSAWEFVGEILAEDDPAAAWISACESAVTTAAGIADVYQVALTVPALVSGWV